MSKNIKELLKATRGRRKASITLSTGEEFDMYFDPLTEAEDDKVREAIERDNSNNAYGLGVLISKAQHKDGSKFFTNTDKPFLRNEVAKADLTKMMVALLDNGGELAGQEMKSDQGGDQK